jgi:hypothetical protein
MSGWFALFLLAEAVSLFSIPILMMTTLMWLVGRIQGRTLCKFLFVLTVPWSMTLYLWFTTGEWILSR